MPSTKFKNANQSAQLDEPRETHPLAVTECDFAEAERFLTTLDEDADRWTFQTIDDDKSRRDLSLTRTLHGTLEEHRELLTTLNAAGAGIFVTVNRTDFTGRKLENITGIRALWQEADRGDEPPLPMEPHITVESSPGRYHRYVIVEGLSVEDFRPVQQRLVDDYGSDPNAKDAARVLRLPGFFHRKKEPYLVRILDTSSEQPLSRERALELFPPVVRRAPELRSVAIAPTKLDNPLAVATALEILDPDMGYQDWLAIGMALHSGAGGDAAALQLWDDWSARGSKHRPGECEDKWETFSSDGAVTLGSLFHMARKAGWDGNVSASDQVIKLVPERQQELFGELIDKYAVVDVEGKTVILYREKNANLGHWVTQFTDVSSLKLRYANRPYPVVHRDKNGHVTGVGERNVVELWLKSPQRKTYGQIHFTPVAGLLAGDGPLPDTKDYNLYQGLNLTPKQGECERILCHIREAWCCGDERKYQYVLGWMARLVQKPNERGVTNLVLKSGEGTGKNTIVEILTDAFGTHAFIASRPSDITGDFNDHLGWAVLLYSNEALWGGDKQHEGAFKVLADKTLSVNRKYLPRFQVANHLHVIFASNNDWVVPVGLDDRRSVILDLDETHKQDPAYFRALHEEIENGGREAFIHFLLNFDISKFDPYNLPDLGSDGVTKLDNKLRGADSVTKWWFERLELGSIPNPIQLLGTTGWDTAAIRREKESIYRGYLEWCSEMRIPRPEQLGSFTKTLGKYGVKTIDIKREGRKIKGYQVPALGEARDHFEKELRTKIQWDADIEVEADENAPKTKVRTMAS
jgi:hypothetical protein